MLKVGTMSYKENVIIIAVKIPKSVYNIDLKFIASLSNDKYLEVDKTNEYT